MPTAHAKLSASSSHRWLECTRSAKLEEKFPNKSSSYADEGTKAHSLAEALLRVYLGGNDGADIEEASVLQSECDKEMQDAIALYMDTCIEKINAARAISVDAITVVEKRLNFSPWVRDGFGTGDMVIIADGIVEICDLKYGKGVPVSAEGNTQMRLYGLGAINEFDLLYDIKTVRMTIIQPRLDSISTDEISAKDLIAWGETVVKPKAELAFEGKGEFSAGDHCRFCRAKNVCRARAEKNLEIAKYEFKQPEILEPTEIADILHRIPELAKWIDDVKKYALDQAVNHGAAWPGWKVVEGGSRRVYTDKGLAAAALLNAGYLSHEIFEDELLSISALEKKFGKAKIADVLKAFITKPPGGPTLAPEEDKRPALNSIIEDFGK
ncbi:MAG: phage-related protein [Firmicutes bacterium]|nr:phage-related protein [Bacillota bacterium]